MSELQDKEAAIEARRKANREAYPAVASIVDEFEAAFGVGQVRVIGGRDFTNGRSFGWNPPPSPNCDSCTGHDGGPGCDRMDSVAYGHDKPEPSKVFCGYRLALASPRNKPDSKNDKGWRR